MSLAITVGEALSGRLRYAYLPDSLHVGALIMPTGTARTDAHGPEGGGSNL